jgi:ADP-ribosylation factor-like protein 2
VVKRLCREDISTISPTLGFNIKTLALNGWVRDLGTHPNPIHPNRPRACPSLSHLSPQCLFYFPSNSYQLNIWDVGGQKSLRSYWRNYFEATDGLVWVVDSADVRRLQDCRDELHKLLKVGSAVTLCHLGIMCTRRYRGACNETGKRLAAAWSQVFCRRSGWLVPPCW